MTYNLFIDDERNPDNIVCIVAGVPQGLEWKIARNSDQALAIVQDFGMPKFMALDHDLGLWAGKWDITPNFLHLLVSQLWEEGQPIPDYVIHSQNSVGRENMRSFMESWKKSVTL